MGPTEKVAEPKKTIEQLWRYLFKFIARYYGWGDNGIYDSILWPLYDKDGRIELVQAIRTFLYFKCNPRWQVEQVEDLTGLVFDKMLEPPSDNRKDDMPEEIVEYFEQESREQL